ncbi:hypothetical protein H0A70_19345 [Alcaligenaceae bacterium]|nr:hypothetical protein [Alcaligenaceae bacterium]
MKTYMGDRTIDGVIVTVDGRSLDPRKDLARYTNGDFEWTYEGDEPRQLAFAILYDHTRDMSTAKAFVEPFMSSVVANLDNEWELTSADIDRFIKIMTEVPSGRYEARP